MLCVTCMHFCVRTQERSSMVLWVAESKSGVRIHPCGRFFPFWSFFAPIFTHFFNENIVSNVLQVADSESGIEIYSNSSIKLFLSFSADLGHVWFSFKNCSNFPQKKFTQCRNSKFSVKINPRLLSHNFLLENVYFRYRNQQQLLSAQQSTIPQKMQSFMSNNIQFRRDCF